MRREENSHIENAGQDSFLDVTTNIVGVLIILVMVVGVRAQNPIVSATQVPTTAELESLGKQAADTEYDVRRMGQEIASLDETAAAKGAARETLATMISAAEKEINDRRAGLNSDKQEDFDLRRQVDANREMIANATTELEDLKSRKAPIVQVNHYPTPISRNLPHQVHFELLGNRIAYVPIDDLAKDAFDDFKQDGMTVGGSRQKSGLVGPRNGFELRYDLEVIFKREGGQMNYEFYITPVDVQSGETMQQVLQQQSEFQHALYLHSPKDTVVVLSVYPDSFGVYQDLKEFLHKMGYGVALFPRGIGEPIMLSNRGVKPMAQ